MLKAMGTYGTSCIKCQKASPGKKHHAPLIPMPIVEEPFHRIAMDIMIVMEQMAEKIVIE